MSIKSELQGLIKSNGSVGGGKVRLGSFGPGTGGPDLLGIFTALNTDPKTGKPLGAPGAQSIDWYLGQLPILAGTKAGQDQLKNMAAWLTQNHWVSTKSKSNGEVVYSGLKNLLTQTRNSGAQSVYSYVAEQGATGLNINITTGKVKPQVVPNAPSPYGPGSMPVLTDTSGTQQYNAITSAEWTITNTWGLPPGTGLDQEIVNMATSGVVNPNEILGQLRQTQAYKDLFPGIEDARKVDANFSEKQYVDIKASYLNTARNAGLPTDFMTSDEMGKLIGSGVSPQEFNDRVMKGYAALKNADPAVKKMFQDMYNVGHGHLLAYFLDPKKGTALIEKSVRAADIQTAAQQSGLGNLGLKGSQQLAGKTVDVGGMSPEYSPREIKAVLADTAKQAPLMTGTVGGETPTVTQSQLIGSQISGYQGTNMAKAQAAVQKASQARLAPFQKGGGYTESQQGVTGLGSAPQ